MLSANDKNVFFLLHLSTKWLACEWEVKEWKNSFSICRLVGIPGDSCMRCHHIHEVCQLSSMWFMRAAHSGETGYSSDGLTGRWACQPYCPFGVCNEPFWRLVWQPLLEVRTKNTLHRCHHPPLPWEKKKCKRGMEEDGAQREKCNSGLLLRQQ